MDHALSILLFIFSGALLLYAALMAITKNYKILPVRSQISVEPKDPKAYTVQFSKVIALVAAAPALGGLIALINPIAGLLVMLAAFIATIWIGTKIMRKVM